MGVLWRLLSTVGDNISTVGDSSSTVEGIQYIGEITSVHWGDNISTCGGITSVLWRVFSTVGIPSVQWGITSVLWRVFSTVGDTFSTVGDNISRFEILRIFNESRNLFQSLFRFEIRSTTSQDSIVDCG